MSLAVACAPAGSDAETPEAAPVEPVVALADGLRAPPASPANIVLVLVDTLRQDHLHVYGYERRTPGHPSSSRRCASSATRSRRPAAKRRAAGVSCR